MATPNLINGTLGNDLLYGTLGDDEIDAGLGNDLVVALVAALPEKAILLAQIDKATVKKLATKAMQYASPAAKPGISRLLDSLSN